MARLARLALLLAAILWAPLPVMAFEDPTHTVLDGSLGCFQLAFYSQLLRYGKAGDSASVQQLINQGFCLIVPSGAEGTIEARPDDVKWRLRFQFRGVEKLIWISPDRLIALP